jgi:hypothetical protein
MKSIRVASVNKEMILDNTEDCLISILLSGYVNASAKGFPSTEYWPSRQENAGRQVLVALLRSSRPLRQDYRNLLADLFDPNPSQAGAERRLVFEFGTAGNRRDHVKNTAIAMHVYEAVKNGANIEAGVQNAMEKFDLSREMVMKVWGGLRPLLEMTDGPLPRSGRPRRTKATGHKHR